MRSIEILELLTCTSKAECYQFWPFTDAEATWVDRANNKHDKTDVFTINFLPTEKIATDKNHGKREKGEENTVLSTSTMHTRDCILYQYLLNVLH